MEAFLSPVGIPHWRSGATCEQAEDTRVRVEWETIPNGKAPLGFAICPCGLSVPLTLMADVQACPVGGLQGT